MKFYGAVGYGVSTETRPGIYEDVITETSYYGDVLENNRSLEDNAEVNPDITTGNRISIVADEFARGNFFAIKYVHWAGVKWVVKKVDVRGPRLILSLGGVFNGSASPSGAA